MPFDFSKLTSVEIEKLPKDKTVVFFPVSSLEDHGPHLSVGAKFFEAIALAQLAAEKLEQEMPGWVGVVYPAAPLALDSTTKLFGVKVRGYVLRDYLVDSVRSMAAAGFHYFACFSASLTPRQLTAIEEASRIVSTRFSLGRSRVALVSACSPLVSAKKVFQSPFRIKALEHGGARDTSVALAISDSSVKNLFHALPAQTNSKSAYWGNPAEATRERGEKILIETVKEIFPKLRAVLEGASPNRLFRSWYSILPPNKSFFRSWILFVLLMGVMLAWLFIMMRGLETT